MPKGAKRRVVALAMGALAMFALAGCYTLKTENVYHADGTLDFAMLMAMDDSLVAEQVGDVEDPGQEFFDQAVADPGMSDLADQLGDSMTLEPYSQDGQTGILVTLTDVTPEQIAEVNSSQGAPAGDSTVTVADGKITLDYVADPDLMANQDQSLAVVADMMGMDEDSLSAYIDLEARHTFPGPVESTTIGTIDPENPNSVIITDLAELNDAAQYTIVASDGSRSGPSWQWILILALLAVAVVGGVVAVLVSRSRRSPATAAWEDRDAYPNTIEEARPLEQ